MMPLVANVLSIAYTLRVKLREWRNNDTQLGGHW